MGSAPISARFLLISLAIVVLLEGIMAQLGAWLQLTRLWVLCVTRGIQLAAILTLAAVVLGDWQALGMGRLTWRKGLKKGLCWSAVFAVIAGLLFLGLFVVGQNPFKIIRTTLPSTTAQQMLFFFVGGIIAPITEEVVFRGLIFGYLLRWGPTTAVFISTVLFAAMHLPTLPITQIIGGLVFAVAYHIEGSLMVPIVIHMLGNLAIFSLSLPFFRFFW
jgi:membrane protease YdiL (CAAX protease family)